MADLEGAAEVALVKVKELSIHVEKAHGAFSALEDQRSRLTGQIESDWSALSDRAKAFVDKAHAEKARIVEEGRDAGEALEDLAESVGSAEAEWDTELGEARSEVAAFGDHVAGAEPQVASMVEQVEASAKSLADRAEAVEAQLQQALAEAREFLQDQVVSDLKAMQEEIEKRASALQAAITGDCHSQLEDKYADWAARLAEVEDTVKEGFTEASQHADDVVDYSLEECRRGHEGAWEELAQLATALEGAIQQLGNAVEQRKQDVDEGWRLSEEAMTENSALLKSATAALEAIKDLMARYSFVQM